MSSRRALALHSRGADDRPLGLSRLALLAWGAPIQPLALGLELDSGRELAFSASMVQMGSERCARLIFEAASQETLDELCRRLLLIHPEARHAAFEPRADFEAGAGDIALLERIALSESTASAAPGPGAPRI